MKYETPEALRAALTIRAQRIAKEQSVNVSDILNVFYFQRLIARVFLTDPTGWLLKGGQALLVRFPMARYTRDIDLFRPHAPDLAEAANALIAAAEHNADDHLVFEFMSRSDKLDGTRIARLSFEVRLGRRRVSRVSVDLVVDSRPLGTPTKRLLQPAINLDWPDDWPLVALYPLEDHVADKIIAMYEQHKNGRASTRYRDLVDLLLIARGEPIDGAKLRAAVEAEVVRRRANGITVDLPDHFQLPHPDWKIGYQTEAASVSELHEYRTIEQATVLARTLLNPVLNGVDLGTWNSKKLRWISSQ